MKRQNKYHFFFGGFRNSLYLCNVVWLRLYDFAECLKKRYFTNYNIKVMKKLLLMKTMLLLCALIVGSSSVWATDVVIFSAAGGGDVPSDWTLIGTDKGSYWLLDAGGTDNITTSAYDLSAYDKATITAQVATYGSGTNSHAKIEISYDGGTSFTEETTQGNPTSSTFVDISYELQNLSNNVVIRVSNSIASGKGLRFKNFVLTGTSSKTAAGLAYSTAKYATTFGAAFATPELTNPNGLAVTYATSDATVADVNASTGAVTIKNKIGSATITASTEGDATHSAGNASYTIYVFEHDGSAANNAYTVTEAKTFIANSLFDADTQYYLKGIVSSVGTYSSTNKTITYYISDNGASTGSMTVFQGKGLNGADFAEKEDMQVLDQVTLLGKFLYYNSSTPQIVESQQVSFKRKADAELVAIADFDMIRDTEKNAETLFTITSTGQISYESSDETIAKVEGGKLKALAVGTATITISSAANDDYNAGSDEVVVTVKNRDAVIPEGASVGGFTKITSESELTDGDYLIVCESQNVAFNGKLETLDATSNYINVTISSNTIASSDATNDAVFTYDATAKTLLSNSGKYIGRTQNKNGLDAGTTAMTNTITFNGDGDAVITSSAGPSLQFNKTSGQTRFRYFTGTQEEVQLYKKSAATSYDITIGATGYKTLISAISATLPAGVTAYKAVSTDAGKIQLTSVASIKAGSAYVLKGAAGNHTLTVTDSPEEPTGNILEVSTDETSNGVYVLSNGSNGVGFYKWMGGSLGAGRAIVPASAVIGGARDFLGFEFETTAIENVKTQNVDGQFFDGAKCGAAIYNLAGQRVAQPTKGLYIVNGRKVIIK